MYDLVKKLNKISKNAIDRTIDSNDIARDISKSLTRKQNIDEVKKLGKTIVKVWNVENSTAPKKLLEIVDETTKKKYKF